MCFSNDNKLLRFLRMTSPAQVLAHLSEQSLRGLSQESFIQIQSVASLYLIKIPVAAVPLWNTVQGTSGNSK